MSDPIPYLLKDRRLQIIREVQARMVKERMDQGRTHNAVRMKEFYDRIYAIVDAGAKAPAIPWATAGIEQAGAKMDLNDNNDKWEIFK